MREFIIFGNLFNLQLLDVDDLRIKSIREEIKTRIPLQRFVRKLNTLSLSVVWYEYEDEGILRVYGPQVED